jgi:hypothetical protein
MRDRAADLAKTRHDRPVTLTNRVTDKVTNEHPDIRCAKLSIFFCLAAASAILALNRSANLKAECPLLGAPPGFRPSRRVGEPVPSGLEKVPGPNDPG